MEEVDRYGRGNVIYRMTETNRLVTYQEAQSTIMVVISVFPSVAPTDGVRVATNFKIGRNLTGIL